MKSNRWLFALIVSIGVLFLFSCDNTTGSDNRVIDSKFRGKWEIESCELYGTTYTLPCTISGTYISSGGYEITATSIKSYANRNILQNAEELYSDGDSFYNRDGQSGVTMQINGNKATIITLIETDYCRKVTRFSWE